MSLKIYPRRRSHLTHVTIRGLGVVAQAEVTFYPGTAELVGLCDRINGLSVTTAVGVQVAPVIGIKTRGQFGGPLRDFDDFTPHSHRLR